MLPQSGGKAGATAASSYPDVEPGSVSQTSLHFTLRGYNQEDLKTISNVAEDIYNRIGLETGLYSYLAGQTFTLVVYKDQLEFSTKTKLPMGVRAVVAGSTVYTYSGPEMDPPLAHNLMHLIFNTYMGQRSSALHWLDEGLAMHMETQRLADMNRTPFLTVQSNKLRTERMPFSQMTFFAGGAAERRFHDVWYLQVESVVSFLLKQGNSLAFAAFLNQLRNGSDLDHAIPDNYTGKFRNLADFETAWASTV